MPTPNIDKEAPAPADMVSEIEATLKSLGVDTTGEGSGEQKPEPTETQEAPVVEPEDKTETPEATEAPVADPEDKTGGEDGKEGEEPAEKTLEEGKIQEPTKNVDDKVEKPLEKPSEEPTGADRDKDFNIQLNPNVAPRTKQVIEDFKKKGIEARNERDAIKKELEETRAKLKEGGMDELTKKELEELRREVRASNIERDPGLRMRYDERIKANETRVLKSFEDRFEVTPELITAIKSKGVTLNTMSKYIKQLEESGDVECADEMREMLRENAKLTRGKAEEIAAIQKDYEGYQARSKAEEERQFAEATERFRGALVEDLQSIGQKYPEFRRPPLPAEGDTDAVKKVKMEAVSKYDKDFAQVVQKIKSCSEDQVLQFRTAAQGIVYRDHVIPSLTAKIADLTAQLEAARGSLGKIKKAGSMTKAVSTPKPADVRPNRDESSGQEDGVDAIIAAAKGLGIKVD